MSASVDCQSKSQMTKRRFTLLPQCLGCLWFVVAVLFAPCSQAAGEPSQKVQKLMSQAMTAYAAGKWNDAQLALQRTAKLQAIDQKTRKFVNDFLSQITRQKNTSKIAGLLRQAQSAREAQDWIPALQLYKQAVVLDRHVKAGVEGVEYVTPYVDVHKNLQAYLGDPKALFDPEVRNRARKLLSVIKDYGLRDQEIDKQSTLLLRRIQEAEEPRTVYLTSDGESEIMIYRVGVLGQFNTRSLLLKSGKYIAVAKRLGYQDVRHEFWVTPDQTTRFDIRCIKSIFTE